MGSVVVDTMPYLLLKKVLADKKGHAKLAGPPPTPPVLGAERLQLKDDDGQIQGTKIMGHPCVCPRQKG